MPLPPNKIIKLEASNIDFIASESENLNREYSSRSTHIPVNPTEFSADPLTTTHGEYTKRVIGRDITPGSLADELNNSVQLDTLSQLDFIDPKEYMVNEEIYTEQMQALSRKVESINDDLGLSGADRFKFEVRTSGEGADAHKSLVLSSTKGKGGANINIPLNQGEFSTFGVQTRYGARGGIAKLDGIEDGFRVRVSDKMPHGARMKESSLMPFNEYVNTILFKALGDDSWRDTSSGSKSFNNFVASLQGKMTDLYDAEGETINVLYDKNKAITSMYDVVESQRVAIEGLSGYGWNYKNVQEFVSEGLSNPTSAVQKMFRGLTRQDVAGLDKASYAYSKKYDRYYLTETKSKGAKELIAKKALGFFDEKQNYRMSLIKSSPHEFRSSQALSRATSFLDTKDTRERLNAMSQKIGISSDPGKIINKTPVSALISGMPGYSEAYTVKNFIASGAYPIEFVDHLNQVGYQQQRAGGSSFFGSAYASDIDIEYAKWRQQKGIPTTADPKAALKGVGIHSGTMQSEGSFQLNPRVQSNAIMKEQAMSVPIADKLEGEDVFLHTRSDLTSGSTVQVGDTLGELRTAGGEVKGYSYAKYEGVVALSKKPGRTSVSIMTSQNLTDQGAVLIGNVKTSVTRDDAGNLDWAWSDKSLMDTDEGFGKGKQIFGIRGRATEKDIQRGAGMHAVQVDDKTVVMGYMSYEDIRGRSMTKKRDRIMKVKGIMKTENRALSQAIDSLDELITRGTGDSVDVLYGRTTGLLEDQAKKYSLYAGDDFANLMRVTDTFDLRNALQEVDRMGRHMGMSSMQLGETKNMLVFQSLEASGIERKQKVAGLGLWDTASRRFEAAMQFSEMHPAKLFTPSFRDLDVDLSRLFLDPISGAEHMAYREANIISGNQKSRIAKGVGMLFTSAGAISQSGLMEKMGKEGLLKSTKIGKGNIGAITAGLKGLSKEWQPGRLNGADDTVFGERFAGIFESFGKTFQGSDPSRTSLHFTFNKDQQRLLRKVKKTAGMSDSMSALGERIIESGFYLPSNQMLGKGNVATKHTGEFLANRHRFTEAFSSFVGALSANQANEKGVQTALTKFLGAMANESTILAQEFGSRKLMNDAVGGSAAGLYGLMTAAPDIFAGLNATLQPGMTPRNLTKAAKEVATIYLNPNDFYNTFGFEYDSTQQNFAFGLFKRDPNLSPGMEKVHRFAADSRIYEREVGIHDYIADMIKADYDADPASIMKITGKGAKALKEKGWERTVAMTKKAAKYNLEVAPSVNALSTVVGAKQEARLREYLDKYEIMDADIQDGVMGNEKEYARLSAEMKKEFGSSWDIKFKALANRGMEIGTVTNSLGEMSTMVFSDLKMKGVLGKTGAQTLRKDAKDIVSLAMAMKFTGESAIRSNKGDALTTAGKGVDFSTLVSKILKRDKSLKIGDIRGLSNKSDVVQDFTQNVLDLFGVKVTEENVKDALLPKSDVILRNMDKLKDEYVLDFGKKAIQDDSFYNLADEIDGVWVLNKERIGNAAQEMMRLAYTDPSSDAGKYLIRDRKIFKMLAKKKGMDASEVFNMFASLGDLAPGDDDYISHRENLAVQLGMEDSDLVAELTDPRNASADAQEKILKDQLEKAETKMSSSTPNKSAGGEAGSFARYMPDFGKGVVAGGVAMAIGFAAAGGLGGGELEAPLPPAVPMGQGDQSGIVSELGMAPTYLMDNSAISQRMNVKGRGSPADFVSMSSGQSGNSNLSINDQSLNDAQYLAQYQSRTSGRF